MNKNKRNGTNNTIAFFDFDGTITKRDSFLDFLFYSIKLRGLLRGIWFLIPIVIGFLLNIIPNDKAKEKVLSYYFKNMLLEDFNRIGKQYNAHRISSIVKKDALQRIAWHKKQGHMVVVVSASLECWLKVWCENHGAGLICTRMETSNGYLTGKLLGKNCFGPEKERRIREQFTPEEYYIFAYGDSRGDKEMLALADEKYYRFFKK
jgi:phosphatidylglycerophosphatase C